MGERENENRYIPRRERKTSRLNMRVSDSEMHLLNQLSYEIDEPVSQIIRKAIKAYLKNRSEDAE